MDGGGRRGWIADGSSTLYSSPHSCFELQDWSYSQCCADQGSTCTSTKGWRVDLIDVNIVHVQSWMFLALSRPPFTIAFLNIYLGGLEYLPYLNFLSCLYSGKCQNGPKKVPILPPSHNFLILPSDAVGPTTKVPEMVQFFLIRKFWIGREVGEH